MRKKLLFRRKYAGSIHDLWQSSKYYYWTMVSLSNVTGSDVKCRVTPYNDNGAEVPQYIEVETSTAVIGNGISEFDIPAHSTRYVRVRVKNTKKNVGGYALIEWSSTDTVARRALLGGVRTNGYSWEGPLGGEYLLNNGQLF